MVNRGLKVQDGDCIGVSKHPLPLIRTLFIVFFSNLISCGSSSHIDDFKTLVVFKIVFPNTKIGCSRVATNSGVSKHSFLQCKGALGRQIVKRERHLLFLRDIK